MCIEIDLIGLSGAEFKRNGCGS